MSVRYFNYGGRPVRMTLDDSDIPERTEVWDPAQKRLVENLDIETDIFFDGRRARAIPEAEFEALLKRLRS